MERIWSIRLGACALLALPAFALWRQDPQALRAQLSNTVHELTTFRELQQGVAAGDPKAVAALLEASAPAPEDPATAEARLQALRARVQALQEILDANGAAPPVAAAPGQAGKVVPASIVSTAPASSAPASTPGAANVAKTAFEAEDFVADRARLGRACWRGGRFQEGIAVLEPIAGDPRADYWRARCLERLERSTEAVGLYRQVIAAAGSTPEGRSAREDCEFLEWAIAHGLAKP